MVARIQWTLKWCHSRFNGSKMDRSRMWWSVWWKLSPNQMHVREMDVDPTVLPRFLWKHILCLYHEEKSVLYFIIFKVFERKETKIKWIYFKRRDIFFHFYIWLLLFLKSHDLFKIPIDNLLWVKIKFMNQSVFLYNHLDFESFVSASLTAAYIVIVQ